MKKVITCIFLVFSILSFSNTFNENEDERTILRKEQRLEQERIQEKYENSKDSYQKDTKIEVDKNELKFYISKINLFDDENLLNEIEKENILSKYENKKLGSTDISNILVELTNRLIEKGYVTSTASLSENNNLNSETLNLKIISGKIEKIILNEDGSLDKLKKYFLVSTKEEKVLNVRDLDTTTENFNYLEANNMTMEIIPSDKENYSIIKLKNEMKDKFTISLLTNNYGEDNQNGIWRGGTSINIDSPLGIGDRVYFSYMTVHKKKADRSWKRTTESLNKRELDLYNFRYTMKFRDYTLSLGSSRSENISSFYTPTTIYDMETMSSSFSVNLDKILWRNQKSKLSLGVGLKRKHNKSYIEDTLLSDRILTIGDISLNGTTVFYGGIFGITLDYERGLRALGASNTPKAEFKKYSLNLNYYKPITKKLVYRFNTLTSHSKDVLYASEKQSIGGVGSVPGYHRRGNIMGDRAIEIENELSYKTIDSEKMGRLSPYISYSYGTVRNNKNPSVYGKGYVSGASIGLRYSMKYLDIDLAYAKALSHSSYIKPRDREIYFSTSLKIRF